MSRSLLPLLAVASVVLAALGLMTRYAHDQVVPVASPANDAEAPAVLPEAPDPDVDRGDPGAVCRAFTTALLDPVADGEVGDRYRQAAAYATSELVAALVAPARRPPPGIDHTPDTSVAVAPYVGDQAPADTSEAAYRAVQATISGVNGEVVHIVYCTLRYVDGIWLIAEYDRARSPS